MSSSTDKTIIQNLFQNTYINKHQTWTKKGSAYAVIVSYGLGLALGVGIMLVLLTSTWKTFGLWVAALAVFHLWEYLYVALFHPEELSFNSFLLNHSKPYTIAFIASVVEYFIERLLFPGMKSSTLTLIVGGTFVIIGLVIRIVAMFTAGSNFHHFVREEREENHKLVTHGIYQYLRHPSYFGWYWYTVGGQILLFNPLCIAAYAFVAYKFFEDRIETEEEALIRFFGNDYREYRAKTIVGIPFIK
jgi:protein-S-isoprenylcysteine O-methyltransferase